VTQTRVDWVDAAKGAAIILVVLVHSGQWATLTGLVPDFWRIVNLVLILFLMPLFFLASGLFARTVITRSWRELWRTRLSPLMWALLVWSVVRFCYFLVVPNPTGMDETNVVDLLLAPVRPSNGLWFLFALAVFFVVAKALDGRLDWRIQLAIAALISIWFFARADTGNIAWNGMGRYVLFFMVGLFFRDKITGFVERRGLPTGLLFGLAFVAFSAAVLLVRDRAPWITGALVLASLLAIAAGLLVSRFLVRFHGMRWLPWVGRNTLPVYVLHIFFVNILIGLVLLVSDQPWLEALRLAIPFAVALVSVLLAIGLWRVTRDVPVLRFGYVPPRWFSGRPAGPLPQPALSPSAAGDTGTVNR
jgi:uncharacterized membrane protein YcfT